MISTSLYAEPFGRGRTISYLAPTPVGVPRVDSAAHREAERPCIEQI
jgi:hypothetical protein